jgi:cytochrome c
MRTIALLALAVALTALPQNFSHADGDAQAGAQAFQACAACHSLIPGRHMTGPSLADIWDRQAGTVAGFPRYSPALKSSDIIWSYESLDAWLANPLIFIPKTRMTFPASTMRKRAPTSSLSGASAAAMGVATPPWAGMMGG